MVGCSNGETTTIGRRDEREGGKEREKERSGEREKVELVE